MATIDEELAAYQEEERARQEALDQQRQEERRRRQQQTRQVARQLLKKEGKQVAAQAGKRVAATAVRAVGAAIVDFLIWASPFILIGILIIGLILLVIVVIAYLCNAGGTTEAVTKGISFLTVDFCQYFEGLSGVVSFIERAAPGGPGAEFCASPQAMAQENNALYPRDNDEELDRLIECIQREPRVVSGGGVGSVFTFERSQDICNYTRGIETCADCAHRQFSCHYGGRTGTTGALAVDFGNEANGPNILQAALACSDSLGVPLNRSTCENSRSQAIRCLGTDADHIHISLGKCDSDNGPINTE